MAARISEQISAIEALNTATSEAIESLLVLAREVDAGDRLAAPAVLEAARVVGRSGQARDGQLIQLLAQADRVKANRGGLVPWIATHLDVTQGRARGIAQSAREIGQLPQLAAPLSSGDVGGGTIRALTRTAQAVKGTGIDLPQTLAATIATATRDGVSAANRQVRVLEETVDPGRGERLLAAQRSRSFLRVLELEGGMCRIEALLDPVRATTVRTALDQQTSTWLRARQLDHAEPVPEDVRTVEQLQAQALTRFAEVFLTCDPAHRDAAFTAPVLYHAPLDPTEESGLAETVYGVLVPRTALTDAKNLATHLIHHSNGQPLLLNGKPIDTHPTARLASRAQRTALAFRDRHCTHPGCTRPPTWSLHAHHAVPHSQGGATTTQNLTLLCAEHHILTHHPGT